MDIKRRLRSDRAICAASFLLCVLMVPSSSHAGFQWVPPEQQAPVYAPAQNGYPTNLVPQIIEAPTAAAPSTAMPSAPAKSQSDLVLGFADNVPLSVALRQVLPSDFGFSVAQDVSMGTLVSWRGGSPWRKVLKDMLDPVGLAVKEQGQMVQVVSALRAEVMPGGDVVSEGSMGSLGSLPELPPLGMEAPSAAPAPMPAPMPAPVAVPEQGHRVMGYLPTPAAPEPVVPPSSVQQVPSYPAQAGAYDVWTASVGKTLRESLEDWCRRSGADLSWQSEFDYPLQANVSVSGSFEDAVRALLHGFEEAKPQPIGRLYRNEEVGQMVLVVRPRGNDYNK